MIRKAELQDVDTIAAIHIESEMDSTIGTALQENLLDAKIDKKLARWRSTILESGVTILIDYDSDYANGFVSFGPFRDYEVVHNDVGEIHTIFVTPRCARKGVGSLLLKAALVSMKEQGYQIIRLWLHLDNTLACAFYEAMGFCQTGDRKEADSGTAILYEIDVTSLLTPL